MDVASLDGLVEVPWETRNLKVPSFELDADSLASWKGQDLSSALANAVGNSFFVQVRVPANNRAQTSMVEALGFRTAELALNPWIDLSRAKLFGSYLADYSQFIPKHTNLESMSFSVNHISDVSENTRQLIVDGSIEAFSTDRFHTDPHCPIDIADARIGLWLSEDLFHDKDLFCTTIYRDADLVGYIVWKKDKFILGGISPEYIGKGFAKLLYLQTMKDVFEGSQELSTTISANNNEVLNLYSRLEFSFRNPTYLFHLWGRPSNQ